MNTEEMALEEIFSQLKAHTEEMREEAATMMFEEQRWYDRSFAALLDYHNDQRR